MGEGDMARQLQGKLKRVRPRTSKYVERVFFIIDISHSSGSGSHFIRSGRVFSCLFFNPLLALLVFFKLGTSAGFVEY
jgi:hypothetical protein